MKNKTDIDNTIRTLSLQFSKADMSSFYLGKLA